MTAKALLRNLVRYSGLLRAWLYLRRKRITILTLHGVAERSSDQRWAPLRQQLAPQQLDACLSVLSKYYSFISLADAIEVLTGSKPSPPNGLVITLDDGYRNSITHALPVLRRHGAPATVFLSTGHTSDQSPFWFDRLDFALQRVPASRRSIALFGEAVEIDPSSEEALRESYGRLRCLVKSKSSCDLLFHKEMNRIATELETESGDSLEHFIRTDDWASPMTWKDVNLALSSGLTIGSHAVGHFRLGLLPGPEVRKQLADSKLEIESRTGRPCFALAYPDGSFTNETIEIARECGYTCAVTSDKGTNAVGCDLLALRRVSLGADASPYRALVQISGIGRAFRAFFGLRPE